MKHFRLLSNKEIEIISALIDAADPDWHCLKDNLSYSHVSEMYDGGMGSIMFEHDAAGNRRYGATVSEAEFFDKDGVVVCIALMVDSSRRLYQLDVWKVDFNPLISFPEVNQLKFVKKN